MDGTPVGSVQVTANGGVVWRAVPDGAVEVVVVHRPAQDDWTFPKGKPHPGESDEACAVREVTEETGLRCVPGHEVGSVTYLDARGRTKLVRYWEMVVACRIGKPDGVEVDDVEWLRLGEVGARLSYDHDRDVLEDFRRWAGLVESR